MQRSRASQRIQRNIVQGPHSTHSIQHIQAFIQAFNEAYGSHSETHGRLNAFNAPYTTQLSIQRSSLTYTFNETYGSLQRIQRTPYNVFQHSTKLVYIAKPMVATAKHMVAWNSHSAFNIYSRALNEARSHSTNQRLSEIDGSRIQRTPYQVFQHSTKLVYIQRRAYFRGTIEFLIR